MYYLGFRRNRVKSERFFPLVVVICEDAEIESIFRGDNICTFANFKYMFQKLTISLTFINPVMLTN